MSSWTSDALWKHSTATASFFKSAGNGVVGSSWSAFQTQATRNGRQRLPARASQSRAMRSLWVSPSARMSRSASGVNQVSTSARTPSRSRRKVRSSLLRWMKSQTHSTSIAVSLQSSCSNGIATPGMAAASMYGKAFSSTDRQLTPMIASILPVWMIAMTSADPSATRTAYPSFSASACRS